MLDCISGGRLIAGFPVGTSMDTNYCYGQIPALTREKYAEAHDLIMKAWTTREPFAFNGRYNKLRYVNIWPRPIQQPHPPIYIPGGGSVETYDFCIDNTYSYSYLSFSGYMRAKALMDGYWKRVAERQAPTNRPIAPASPRRSASPTPTREAERLYSRARRLLLQPLPARLSGLRRRAGLSHDQDHPDRRAVAVRAGRAAATPTLTWKDLTEGGHVIAGSPETVRQRMEELIKTLRVGNVFCLHARRQHAGRQGARIRPSCSPRR